MFETDPNSLTPEPDAGIAATGYQLLYYLNAHDFQSVKFYGYIAASLTSPEELINAIRGTETLEEWLLNFSGLPLPYLGKGFVPAGFRGIADFFPIYRGVGHLGDGADRVLEYCEKRDPLFVDLRFAECSVPRFCACL
jgi:hypothetical protein